MYCKEKEVSILLPVNLSNTKKILSTFVKIDTHTKTLIFFNADISFTTIWILWSCLGKDQDKTKCGWGIILKLIDVTTFKKMKST